MRYWLLDKRNAMCMRQVDVAKRVGITQSGYCQIERGNTDPSVKTAKKIAAVFDVNWTDFFPGGASVQAESKRHFVRVRRVKVTANRKGTGIWNGE